MIRPRFFPLVSAALLAFLAGGAAAQAGDPDTDGDGLSDFQERHKYGTDPASADSDGDGVRDGDWDERREYAYTVRTIVQVMPPVTDDVLRDDYQDARVLDRTDEYVELEVIHYPLCTAGEAIVANPDWRKDVAGMREWLAPGATANWDEELRGKLVEALAAEGIAVDALDDKTLVERAARFLLRHADYQDGFSTFCSAFVDGEVRVYPGLEQAAADGVAENGLSVAEQWQRELFAKGMFEHRKRGSCTSSAIYLDGCLRALGIPTRIVLAIPCVDGSDERELGMVRRLRHHAVRRTVLAGVERLGRSWASHTFNEVYVGGRWRRLNYERLGQGILDGSLFGLITHTATFSDWIDGNMAATWGLRQATKRFSDDAFGGANPYSTVAMSDRFGAHAAIDNPLAGPGELTELTITKAYWFDSPERPSIVDMRLDDPKRAGHVVVHVREVRPDGGLAQYRAFYDNVGKRFTLRAGGHPDVPLRAARGYWVKPEDGVSDFYLRIDPSDLPRMAFDIPYRLVADNGHDVFRWVVADGVTLARPPAAAGAEGEEIESDAPTELVVDRVLWADAPESPTGPIEGMPGVLLLHVGAQVDFPEHKRFTQLADRTFLLEADGHPTIEAGTGVGGVTSRGMSFCILSFNHGRRPAEGVEYVLRPRNDNPTYRWKLAKEFRIRR